MCVCVCVCVSLTHTPPAALPSTLVDAKDADILALAVEAHLGNEEQEETSRLINTDSAPPRDTNTPHLNVMDEVRSPRDLPTPVIFGGAHVSISSPSVINRAP